MMAFSMHSSSLGSSYTCHWSLSVGFERNSM